MPGPAAPPGAATASRPAPPATAAPARRRPRRTLAPYAYAGLGAVFLLVFAGIPLLWGIGLSVTDTRLLRPNGGSFVGLENYAQLFSGSALLRSVLTTLVYSAATVAGALVLGTVSAVVLNRAFPGRLLARAVIVMPWAVPTVAVALVFRWIYNDSAGVANTGLRALGIGEAGWLTDPDFGMVSVLVATVWKVTPFVMLVVLAALQSVPEELYKATRVDGADALATFRLVVLPFLAPTLKIAGLLMTIWSFRRFEIIWLLTGGGPVDATNTVVVSLYREAFNNSRLGLGAAIGVVGLSLSVVVTAVYFAIERRNARQEAGS
ncbi:Glucosamine ABC transport system, permease protein 2 [Pseudonocardia sp. Ae168_Ps1]|uniref:carbohydrate ABC transporter permease n=1 Tax=unclassified Pseudonocardia TaxID=2619320 RepID=UPI0009670559|nr:MULTISPECIES: sugar ABC transporter permease [unclassified Pseudonocardia]OLL72417.1 Glucosamine ABC transport system, permease protein 2 [Pseudonocardia sp. Ae150A_Ps1]OLL78389.1 Glucosamine ABC transport system, permease protein 2 [Pseudonocardia sp. Ae168_Ps1]OLL87485.1 Glucosamine ABC transport system, permease protein 2 [Pseudonocardia sp. Ae263_Ps1]OLL92486.1 Glucosamine ABC transport system, permease protein 2 [Pseudonocardia sp. Ae356_Ps1]